MHAAGLGVRSSILGSKLLACDEKEGLARERLTTEIKEKRTKKKNVIQCKLVAYST